jgi:hypothetical protein
MTTVRASVAQEVTPLCVDLKAAARLISVSVWTLRSYITEGLIATVKLPSSKHSGEVSRRVLISVEDLREFVRRHRDGAKAS